MIAERLTRRYPVLVPNGRVGLLTTGLAITGVIVATLAGREVADGQGPLVAGVIAAAAFLVWTLAEPEHAALAVIVALPFLIYPSASGGLSLFAAVPLVGVISVALLLAQSGSVSRLRHRLSLRAFAVMFVIAVSAALHSTSLSTASSRLVYLALFGIFAWALAASITDGRLSHRAVARAVVISAAVASVALIIQFVVQFQVGHHTIITWLIGEFRLFAGERAAGIASEQQNWVVGTLNVVRSIFPFMSAPSAGQYAMLGLVAAVWLWRTRPAVVTPVAHFLMVGSIVVIAAAMLMTFSRQSWVGALAGLGALTLRRNVARPVLIVALVFVFLAVIPAPGTHTTFGDYLLTASDTGSVSSGTRLGLLTQAIHLIPHHWLLGVGPGLYGTLNPNPANPVYYAHNVWLDEAVELGIFGVLAMISLCLFTMRSALRRRAMLGFALLTAFVVANLFDDVLFFPRNGVLLGVAFALAAADESARSHVAQRPARSVSAALYG